MLFVVVLTLPARTLFFVVVVIIIVVVRTYVRSSRQSRTNLLAFGESWIYGSIHGPVRYTGRLHAAVVIIIAYYPIWAGHLRIVARLSVQAYSIRSAASS